MILDEIFEWVVVISLKEQVERRDRALSVLRSANLSDRVQVFDAIVGKNEVRPKWWPNGAGAWGCYRSHVEVLIAAKQAGVSSVLILEDDVVWANGAVEAIKKLMSDIPSDWAQLYLGGQHRWEPQRIADKKSVLIGRSVHRTHAYAVRGDAIDEVLKHLDRIEDFAESKQKGEKRHIDHHLEDAHRKKKWPVYSPLRWIAGQGEAYSTILGRHKEEQWWQPRKILEAERKLIIMKERKTSDVPFVIFGTPRSGSTLLIRMLNKMDGIACNGERRDFLWCLKGLYDHRSALESRSPHSFEDLDTVVERNEFPSHHNKSTKDGWSIACENTLRAWCGGEGESGSKAWGMKEVHVGKIGGQYLFQICDWLQGMVSGIKFIFLTRELEATLISMMKNPKWWIPAYASCAAGCERAIKTQKSAMSDYAALYPSSCIELDYKDLLNFETLQKKLKEVNIELSEEAWKQTINVKI